MTLAAVVPAIGGAVGPGVLCQWCEDDHGLQVRASGQHGGLDLCEYCLRGDWNPARGTEGSKLCGIPGCGGRLAVGSREKYCAKDRSVAARAAAEKPLRVSVPAGRRPVKVKFKPLARPCQGQGCEQTLRSNTKGELCGNCRASVKASEAKFCTVCQKKLAASNRSGYCYPHRVKPVRAPRLCACGCGAEVKSRWPHLVGHGPQRAAAMKSPMKYVGEKRKCAGATCDRKINAGNQSGFCAGCRVVRREPRFCKCGCGARLRARWEYVKNHGPAVVSPKLKKGEHSMAGKLCKCGCGEPAGKRWEYKRGHKGNGPASDGGAKPVRKAKRAKGVSLPAPVVGAPRPTIEVNSPGIVDQVNAWWAAQSPARKVEIALGQLR